MPPTGRHLRRGQRDADPGATSVADEVQQRPPPTAEIEHAAARPDPDLLGDILMLAPLGVLEAQGEVAVVLRAAEVGELTQTQPKDPIDQRIGELEIRPVRHRDRSYPDSSYRRRSLVSALPTGTPREGLARLRAARVVAMDRFYAAVADPIAFALIASNSA